MTELVAQQPQSTGVLERYNGEERSLICDVICKNAPVNEIRNFLLRSKAKGLDPLSKQVYLIPRKDKNGKITYTDQTSIDGQRSIAAASGLYAGVDEPVYDNDASPQMCKVTVYRLVNGQPRPFVGVARWKEKYPGEKMGFMWRNLPWTMLAKCAESEALRKAFPVQLGGIYVAEEMENQNPVIATNSEKIEKTLIAEPEGIPKAPLDRIDNMLERYSEFDVSEADILKDLGYTSKDQITVIDMDKLLKDYMKFVADQKALEGKEND